MDNNIIFKHGYWEVNGKKYFNKPSAVYDASQTRADIKFNYNDHIWDVFDRTQLGKYKLNDLYRYRARQIRDKYDYLVLYYSGGCDSHNILRTFIDNNIPLDEVCVKWPQALRDGKYYTVNNLDTSAENYWSEWNYCVKPRLEWIAANTNIKINIIDPITEFRKQNAETVINQVDHNRNPGAVLLNNVASNNTVLYDSNTGHIYGIDKPLLYLDNSNNIYMFFSDLALSNSSKYLKDPESIEYFYWSTDIPTLPFEMAYQMSIYFQHNPEHRIYLKWKDKNICEQFQNNLARKICYTTWDFMFQADKPKNSARNDKFKWVNNVDELSDIRNSINNLFMERKQGVIEKYVDENGIYNTCRTKFFRVVTL